MNKLLKKLLMITPILIVGILIAAFLPNILTFAQPGGSRENTGDSTQSVAAETVSAPRNDDEKKTMISRDEAREIALDKINGRIDELELDDDKYEVEIHADGKEYEFKINAYTGEIFDFEVDDKDDDDDRTTSTSAATTAVERTMISREEARAIALAKVNGRIDELELDDDKYEVEIHADGKEYEFKINAYTGKITDFEVDDQDDDDNRYSTKPASTSASTTTAKRSRISSDEARAIALNKVNGTIVDFELDDDEYEVEIHANGKKYEIEINAYTGKITDFDVDDLDDDRYSTKPASTTASTTTANRSRISSDEARVIALNKVSGTIVDFELDDDEYEVEIHANGKEYEITIDAYTGKITDFEIDDLNDEDDYYDDDRDDDDDGDDD